MGDLLVVNSKVRETVKKLNVNISSDFTEALSKHTEEVIKKAVNRCKGNNRKTVRGFDL